MSAVSPRTPEKPMAFTNDELLRGGCRAWCAFLVVLLVGMAFWNIALDVADDGKASPRVLTALVVTGICALLAGGGTSLVLLPFGVALALPIGRALERVRAPWVHLLVYSILGVAIGAAYVALLRGDHFFTPFSGPWDALVLVPAVDVLIAVPFGWWQTARLALRADLVRSAPAPVDAEIEDAEAGAS